MLFAISVGMTNFLWVGLKAKKGVMKIVTKSQEQDLKGKTIVVTGANSGIGFEACYDFAQRGAEIALVCRDEERGKSALERLKHATGNQSLRLFIADFSSMSQIVGLATELLANYPRIHVLCNNAGGANPRQIVTEQGFELTLVSNHLSGFLLTKLLLGVLRSDNENEASRVVFTSSLGHKNSAIDFDDLNLNKGYGTLRAYGRSKLMNLLSARAFHSRHGKENIVFSSFHPGTVRTPIWSKGGLLASILGFFMYPFMWTAKKGADTLIWLATSSDSEAVGAGGRYFFNRKRGAVADFATDDAADALWVKSEALLADWL